MAISEWLPGLDVGICVNGDAATEYDLAADEEDAPKAITKYIEASSGQAFEIIFNVDESFEHVDYDLALYICIDGKKVASHVYKSCCVKRHTKKVSGSCFFDSETGIWTERPFMFTALSTDNSENGMAISQSQDQIRSLGLVDIRICRVECKGRVADSHTAPIMLDVGAIPEKALKGSAVSHSTVLGEAVVISSICSVSVKDIDTWENPLYTFNFKYRSISALKSMLIVPRSPSPETLVERARRDPDSLNREELLELQRLRNNEDVVQSAIKQEQKRARAWSLESNSQLEPSLSTITEQFRKRARRSGNSAREAIDLCDD